MARLYHLTCIGHFPKIVPMLVPGPLLKQMEEKQEIFQRVERKELEALGMADDQMTVSVVVGWDLDEDAPSVKYGEHVGPDVVWLTSDPTPKQAWQSLNDHLDIRAQKSQILYVVEIPDEDLHKWSEWAFEQGISKFWYDALDDDDGSADNWYVVPREIPKAEWVAVYMAQTGEAIWLNPDLHEIDPEDLNDKGLIKVEVKDKYEQKYPIPRGYFAARLQTEV